MVVMLYYIGEDDSFVEEKAEIDPCDNT